MSEIVTNAMLRQSCEEALSNKTQYELAQLLSEYSTNGVLEGIPLRKRREFQDRLKRPFALSVSSSIDVSAKITGTYMTQELGALNELAKLLAELFGEQVVRDRLRWLAQRDLV